MWNVGGTYIRSLTLNAPTGSTFYKAADPISLIRTCANTIHLSADSNAVYPGIGTLSQGLNGRVTLTHALVRVEDDLNAQPQQQAQHCAALRSRCRVRAPLPS